MIIDVMKCFLVSLTFLIETQAFWWQPKTTETPTDSAKHIPLTYFRTYTYQPLIGGPFSFPYGFGGAAQTPILNGERYEQYNFPPNQHFSGGPLLSAQRPFLSQSQPATSTVQQTTPSTTTTTTTTPAPTTTTSTTTTTTTSSLSQHPIEPLINSGGGTYGSVPQYESSPYNRRFYMNNYNDKNYYRPHYPYPDYATVTKPASMLNRLPPRPSHVQFVPCMCPISVGIPSGLPIVGGDTNGMALSDPMQNIYKPHARSNDNDDDKDDNLDMRLPLDEEEYKIKSRDLNNVEKARPRNDARFSDDSESTILETNKIDSGYRKPKVESIQDISS